MGSSPSTAKDGHVNLREKALADEQAQKQALNDLHRYVEDPEDLEMLGLTTPPLIAPEAGFRVELGGLSPDSIASPVLEEVEKHSLYYKNNFCNKAHFNFVGGNGANPLILSLVQLDKRKNGYGYSALLRTKKDDYIYTFTAKDRKEALKHTKQIAPDLQGVGLLELVKDTKLVDELAHMEDRILIKAYRVGVVYAGLATNENQMFGNNEPSEGFLTFMNWLGKHIKLKGYAGFKGGLDVEHNTTGTHSYVTSSHGFDIMFHVSTELPFSDVNPQQVERKRHIGNDVVVIVYQDGPTDAPFKASSITSKFNHVYILVQAVPASGTDAHTTDAPGSARGKRAGRKAKRDTNSAVEIEPDARVPSSSPRRRGGKLKYRIAVVSKHGVHPHGPVLPSPDHLWDLDDTFRQFLLTKIVNAERAAYYAPGFGQARTRRLWLKQLLEKYGSAPKSDSGTSPSYG